MVPKMFEPLRFDCIYIKCFPVVLNNRSAPHSAVIKSNKEVRTTVTLVTTTVFVPDEVTIINPGPAEPGYALPLQTV